MGALVTFKKLVEWASAIPSLVELNAAQRQETRDAVGGVADELHRGLDLVAQRIEGAKIIASSKRRGAKKELVRYLLESEGQLVSAFSEFKICRGLREKRDHFQQLFHPARRSVRIQNMATVTHLLSELESDERLIIDEVGPLLMELRKAAGRSLKGFGPEADHALKQIKNRQRSVKRTARKIHDKL